MATATTARTKASRTATVTKLKDYQAKLVGHDIIGSLLWYSITGLVTNDQLADAFDACGLDANFLPRGISPANAFKSACTIVSRANTAYPLAVNGQIASLEIKSITADAEQMVYHILRNVTDGKREKAHQDKVGEIRFNRGRRVQTGRVPGSESYRSIIRSGISPLDLEQVTSLIARFDATYLQLTTYRDSADVRTILREYLSELNAIAVKPQGALYFVGTEHQDILDRLQQFVRMINPENLFHQVPLVDTDEQRDMLGEAFTNQLLDEANGLIGKIRTYRDTIGRDPADARKYAAFRADYETILSRREDALERLDRTDARAAATLELLFNQISDLAKSANAATKRRTTR